MTILIDSSILKATKKRLLRLTDYCIVSNKNVTIKQVPVIIILTW